MPSPRILIVRLSAIGDVIQTMPVACALRERFPQAMLAWAVQERAGTLLRGHEAIDELILLPRGWLKSPGGVWQLRRKLRDLQFDVAIDVQSLTKSAFLAWLSGAKRRIGFGNPGGRELSKWLNNVRVDPKTTHVVDRYLELLRPLGIESPAVRFQVPEHEEDRKAAEQIVGRMGLEAIVSPGGADIPVCHQNGTHRQTGMSAPPWFAVVNPGAGWPSKLWPAERYAAVARHLGDARGLATLVVWAGQAERLLAEQVVANARRRGPHGAADHASAIGRAGPPGEAVHRFGHRPFALGRGGGHAVRGPLWSLARRPPRPLWSAAHCLAEDVFRGPHPCPAHRPGHVYGEHHDGDGMRSVRPSLTAIILVATLCVGTQKMEGTLRFR